MRQLFLSLFVAFISQSAIAQSLPSYNYDDYDYEKYARVYEQQQRDLDRGEADLRRRQDILRDVSRRLEEVTRQLADKNKRLKELRDLEQNHPRIRQEIEQRIARNNEALRRAEENIRNIDQAIAVNQGLQQQAAAKVQAANKEVAEASEALKNAIAAPDGPDKAKKIEEARFAVGEARKKLTAAEAEHKTHVSQGQDLARQRQQFLAEPERARREIAEDTRKLQNLDQEVARARQEIQRLAEEIRNISQNELALRREVELRTRERDESARYVDMTKSQMNQTARRIEQVNFNIKRAGEAIEAVADTDASSDGRREGRELGQARGDATGKANGIAKGREEGTKAGQDRDFAAGRAAGQADAKKEATRRATEEAEAEGKAEGTALGTQQGLQAAYDEGRARGEAAANDQAAYKVGRGKGEAQGLKDAIKDAQYREKEGYDEREKHYRSQPLKPVVQGKVVLSKNFEGVQGRYSPSGDDRYYNPRPSSYPHPRLKTFYMTKYDAVYMRVLEDTYRTAYDTAEDLAFKHYREITRKEYESKDYPDSRKEGRDYGWKETYGPVFTDVKTREKKIRKEKYRQIAYDANKNDQGQKDKGYREGNAFASENKGYGEGHAAAYAANIEIEKNKAHKAGIKRADDLYMNNAVLEMVGMALIEEDQDGIFRPGEGVQVQIKLKNYGLVGKSGLTSVVSNAKSIKLTQASVGVAEIPAQSDVTATIVVQAQIDFAASEGEVLSLQADLKDAQKVLLTKTFQKTAQYPTKLAIAGFDGILIPGVATPVRLVITNKSSKVQNLELALAVDTSRVQSDKHQLTVTSLGAGQSQEHVVTLTGSPEAQFEESLLKIVTTQTALQFAPIVNMTMTIIQRHSPQADSRGLIISANLAQGGGKAMFASDKLDTWDLRVDGALKANSLDPYLQKVVHIMGDAKANMDANSLNVISQFIHAKKGTLIVWGSKAHESVLVKQLAGSLGAANMSATYLNETLSGAGSLAGVSVQYNGHATVMSAADKASSLVLGRAAVARLADGQSERMGLAMLVGLEPSTLTAQDMIQIPAYANMHNLSFSEKVDMTKASPAHVILVINEILAEINQVEINRSERYYKDKGKGTKMGRAIIKYLKEFGEKSAPSQEFIRYYPNVINAVNTMGNTVEAFQASLVMETRPSTFGSTWKQAWCKKNGSHQLCRQDFNP